MSDWRARARCRDHPDPSVFFPSSPGEVNAGEAKAVCAQCPVRAECLAHALEHDEAGVWGGLGEEERRRMARRCKRCEMCGDWYDPTARHQLYCGKGCAGVARSDSRHRYYERKRGVA